MKPNDPFLNLMWDIIIVCLTIHFNSVLDCLPVVSCTKFVFKKIWDGEYYEGEKSKFLIFLEKF